MGRALADRAAQQNGRAPQNGGPALAVAGEEARDGIASLKTQIERMAPEYQKAMPRGREAAQMVRDAITCLRNVRGLDKCEPVSVLGALMTCAQLDLRPGVLGHAWPLPFYDKSAKGYKAQLVIGYKGYIELGHRSGKLRDIAARIAYAEDPEFDYWLDEDGPHLRHSPLLDGERTKIRSFYALARLVNSGSQVAEPTSLAMMEAHRDKYAPRNDKKEIVGPWRDHFAQMGRKTKILNLFGELPKSAAMAIAMEADDGVRVDLNPEASAEEVTERVVPGVVIHDDPPPPDHPSDDDWAAA